MLRLEIEGAHWRCAHLAEMLAIGIDALQQAAADGSVRRGEELGERRHDALGEVLGLQGLANLQQRGKRDSRRTPKFQRPCPRRCG